MLSRAVEHVTLPSGCSLVSRGNDMPVALSNGLGRYGCLMLFSLSNDALKIRPTHRCKPSFVIKAAMIFVVRKS